MKSLRETLAEYAANKRDAVKVLSAQNAGLAMRAMELLTEAEEVEYLLSPMGLDDEIDPVTDLVKTVELLHSAFGSWSSNPAEEGRNGVKRRVLTMAAYEASKVALHYRIKAQMKAA